MRKRPRSCSEFFDHDSTVQSTSRLDDQQLFSLICLQLQAEEAAQGGVEAVPTPLRNCGGDLACMEQQRRWTGRKTEACRFAWNCTAKACTYDHPDGRSIDDYPAQGNARGIESYPSQWRSPRHEAEKPSQWLSPWQDPEPEATPAPLAPSEPPKRGGIPKLTQQHPALASLAAEKPSQWLSSWQDPELEATPSKPRPRPARAPASLAADQHWQPRRPPQQPSDDAAPASALAPRRRPAAEEAAVAATPAARHATREWPEVPELISGQGGQGRWHGKPPRGAGIVAIMVAGPADVSACGRLEGIFACIVEKANGKCGFPKGGRDSGESIWDGALREWDEETGIPSARLAVQPGEHIDDAFLGVRYLIARCSLADPASADPDAMLKTDGLTWAPPNEDPSDRDPIVKAHWVPVSKVFRNGAGLRKEHVEYVRRAAQVHLVDAHAGGQAAVPAEASRTQGGESAGRPPRRWGGAAASG